MLLRTLFILLLALPLALPAQEKKADAGSAQKQETRDESRKRHTYKLEFLITEFDGNKRIDSRGYSALLREDVNGRIRVGTRVPIRTGQGERLIVQYMDVGTNIDATVFYTDDASLRFNARFEFSSILATDGERPAEPTLRNVSAQSEALLPLGKQTLLFNLDEPNSKRSFQIQVTPTLVH